MRGRGGRGLLHEVGLAGAPDVVMTTTLSKALGSQGGVVLGPAAVRAHLIDAARPFIFDTGLAPAAVGAAWAALGILRREPGWRSRSSTAPPTWPRSPGSNTPESAVVSVVLGDPQVAYDASLACRERGLSVGCFRPPSVPEGTSRLRLTARANMTPAELEPHHRRARRRPRRRRHSER